MQFFKRITLYILTNLLVVATLSILISMFGFNRYLTPHGLDYQMLAGFCLIWGFTGSFIALLLSRWSAKTMMGVKLVSWDTRVEQERRLLHVVQVLSKRAGLNRIPEIGIYASSELNAFATGPSKNRALVAVSSGLLNQMTPQELEGVLAHELSHVVNGDMVTMTLLQGTVNAFTLFISRIIAYSLREMMLRRDKQNNSYRSVLLYSTLQIICDIVITLLGSLVVAAFSRHREYRADKGGAKLSGHQQMIAALMRLKEVTMPAQAATSSHEALKINVKTSRFSSLLSTHPDIDLRIQALLRRSGRV